MYICLPFLQRLTKFFLFLLAFQEDIILLKLGMFEKKNFHDRGSSFHLVETGGNIVVNRVALLKMYFKYA